MHQKLAKLAKDLTQEERDKFIVLLTKYLEVSSWSYKDMSGIDQDIVQYKIPTDLNMRLVSVA